MREPINFLPTPEIARFIAGYGILEFPEGVSESYFSPPLGLSGFIIHTINIHNIIDAKIEGKDQYTGNAVATGQVTFPVYGQNVGKAKILLIFFHPLGMHQLFGTNMAKLTNSSQNLEEFLGAQEAHTLLEELKTKQDNLHQVKVLNNFFSSRKLLQNETLERISNIIDYIHQKKGSVSIREMEDLFHYPKKTLERHFNKMVGICPKVYCQIYKFKCLFNLIKNQPGITWVQIAGEAGYYDQSHMSRYVKEYLKVSPKTIIKMDLMLINYLLTR